MNRIADLRTDIQTVDQARETFRDYALCIKHIAAADARFEKQIAQRTAAHDQRTAPLKAQAENLKLALASFITANPGLFQKPRTIKTDFGEFGLRTVTELSITDESALLEALLAGGHSDCFERLLKPVKTAIRERIKSGEKFPGCTLKTGDTAVCKVARALLDEAREEVA
jgi:hypothetical protein